MQIPNIPEFTTKEDTERTIDIISKMGFEDLDVFDYIIREEEE